MIDHRTDDSLRATDVLALGDRLRVAEELVARARDVLAQIDRSGDRIAALSGATLTVAVHAQMRALDTLIAYDRALLLRLGVLAGVLDRSADPDADTTEEPTP